MALGLAACDSGSTSTGGTGSTAVASTPTQPPGGSTGGSGATQKVVLAEWAVQLPVDQLQAGQTTLQVDDAGTMGHDLVIQDSTGAEVGRTPVFKKEDGTKTLQVDLKPGTYKFFCDLPGHASKGMQTQITVK